MIFQKDWFDIGDQVDLGFLIGVGKSFYIWELVCVLMKDVVFVFNCSVVGGQLEIVVGYVFVGEFIQKFQQLFLGIVGVGIGYCGVGIVQFLMWYESGFVNECMVLFNNF